MLLEHEVDRFACTTPTKRSRSGNAIRAIVRDYGLIAFADSILLEHAHSYCAVRKLIRGYVIWCLRLHITFRPRACEPQLLRLCRVLPSCLTHFDAMPFCIFNSSNIRLTPSIHYPSCTRWSPSNIAIAFRPCAVMTGSPILRPIDYSRRMQRSDFTTKWNTQ